MSFARQLNKVMTEKEITQAELCRRTGLAKSSISQYTSGKNIPSQETLKRIADALNCSVEFLCLESDENEVKKFRNISITEAARRLDKSEQFVRVGLQTGRLLFGTAVKMSGRWSYHISPKLFDEYIGKEDGE